MKAFTALTCVGLVSLLSNCNVNPSAPAPTNAPGKEAKTPTSLHSVRSTPESTNVKAQGGCRAFSLAHHAQGAKKQAPTKARVSRPSTQADPQPRIIKNIDGSRMQPPGRTGSQPRAQSNAKPGGRPGWRPGTSPGTVPGGRPGTSPGTRPGTQPDVGNPQAAPTSMDPLNKGFKKNDPASDDVANP